MKLKWEVPKLVDLGKSANGAIADCQGGSAAIRNCWSGGHADTNCDIGGSNFDGSSDLSGVTGLPESVFGYQ